MSEWLTDWWWAVAGLSALGVAALITWLERRTRRRHARMTEEEKYDEWMGGQW
jgi:hypothetical protein